MMILFAVYRQTQHFNEVAIVTAKHREQAKSKAFCYLGGNRDKYIVSPLTNGATKIHFDITVSADLE